MLRAGAGSYIVKSANAEEILATVVRAANGESILAAQVAGGVMGELAPHLERSGAAETEMRLREEQISAVIDGGRLRPVFQPIVELASREAIGFEALARFDVEPRESPQWWFEGAEAVGLRAELELAAAETALDAFRAWGGPGYLALNASPLALISLHRLVGELASRVVVEITEHTAIDDYDVVAGTLRRLRTAGIRIAIDDAGAGFASFRHVLELAPDYVTLDLSLTRCIDRDPRRRALAYGLNAFADERGIAIIAEGIETQAELDALREIGVALGQGRFLAPPGPLPHR